MSSAVQNKIGFVEAFGRAETNVGTATKTLRDISAISQFVCCLGVSGSTRGALMKFGSATKKSLSVLVIVKIFKDIGNIFKSLRKRKTLECVKAGSSIINHSLSLLLFIGSLGGFVFASTLVIVCVALAIFSKLIGFIIMKKKIHKYDEKFVYMKIGKDVVSMVVRIIFFVYLVIGSTLAISPLFLFYTISSLTFSIYLDIYKEQHKICFKYN